MGRGYLGGGGGYDENNEIFYGTYYEYARTFIPVFAMRVFVAFFVMSDPTTFMQDFSEKVDGKSVRISMPRISTALKTIESVS